MPIQNAKTEAKSHYGIANSKISEKNHQYEYISDYSKGVPVELTEHDWYHELTKEQAESALSIGKGNRFLIRPSANNLVLSSRILGWQHHYVIESSPRGYTLEGKNEYFKSISEMLTHYQRVPIDEKNDQLLGTAFDRTYPGTYVHMK